MASPPDDDLRGPAKPGLFEHLLKVRYGAVVVVILTFLHALAFLIMGAQIAFKTYWHILTGTESSDPAERPAVELLHSLDLLLVALVLIILASGVAKLFLMPHGPAARRISLPNWLHIETFSDLKILLWETILLALLIVGLAVLASGMRGGLDWTALVIPAAIFLLASSLHLMKKK